jgi:hypothetical protein
MAYQNRKHNNYGWGHIHEVYELAYPHHHHHQKRRVAINEEPIAEAHQSYYIKIHGETETETDRQGARFGYQNGVDQEAEAFIQHEHRRMALAKLMSSRKAT